MEVGPEERLSRGWGRLVSWERGFLDAGRLGGPATGRPAQLGADMACADPIFEGGGQRGPSGGGCPRRPRRHP